MTSRTLRLLPIIEQAAAEGFTHVLTMSGPVPLEQFHYRDTLGYSYADGAIYGPWRAATTLAMDTRPAAPPCLLLSYGCAVRMASQLPKWPALPLGPSCRPPPSIAASAKCSAATAFSRIA